MALSSRVRFIATASGDADGYVEKFYDCFATAECETSHLPLFRRSISDLAGAVAQQDVVYVGGGNTANLLAVWRTHGLADVLRAEAERRDIVVGGLSAGAMCWFEAGLTDSFGPSLGPSTGALGWLPGSFCPHYDGEVARRAAYHSAVMRGSLPSGIACDDGAAACGRGGRLVECVTEAAGAGCYTVERAAEGVVETPLPVRLLTTDCD